MKTWILLFEACLCNLMLTSFAFQTAAAILDVTSRWRQNLDGKTPTLLVSPQERRTAAWKLPRDLPSGLISWFWVRCPLLKQRLTGKGNTIFGLFPKIYFWAVRGVSLPCVLSTCIKQGLYYKGGGGKWLLGVGGCPQCLPDTMLFFLQALAHSENHLKSFSNTWCI